MRILVVGAGATGGYFGGRLAEAGRDVTFLVRPARARQIEAGGLQIVSPHGNATLKPKLVTADAIGGPFDVVLLTVKAWALDAALADIAPAVGPQTMVLPVLNGMKHVDVIKQRFGAERLIGGVCRVAADLDAEGRIVQLGKLQDLVYGELDGTRSERIEALDKVMQGVGFNAQLSDNVARDMWEKWIFLSSLGAATCLMRGTIGEIEAAPGGAAFVASLLGEIVAVVRAAGVPPREGFFEQTLKTLTLKGSSQASSMYRDLMKGNAIEADQIIGDLLARGEAAGVATPLLAAVYANLAIYQARQAGK
jgi:2-dehydropantoate 2-reductase